MSAFASRLRQRAKELGISNAEAARRSGMSEARFWNYTKGTREPDIATLIRIAEALGTSVDWLVGFESAVKTPSPATAPLRQRLNLAADALADPDLEFIVLRAEALAALPQPKG